MSTEVIQLAISVLGLVALELGLLTLAGAGVVYSDYGKDGRRR